MADLSTESTIGDDLSRNVCCIFGMPIDVCDLLSVSRDIETAAAGKVPLFITLPNLNTLVNFQSDADFRESLFQSNLCPPDGMPIVWIARLLGIPIKRRVAGSDLFDILKAKKDFTTPLKVFLFGGPEGAALAACQMLNARPSGLCCVGWIYPGFGSVEEMSRDEVIDRINSSGADFLVVSLGAKKGQSWLLQNQQRLQIPVRAHLGAVINFQAGTVKRAPRFFRRLGLEWLWRIMEEPSLWRRYWNDAGVLLRMLVTRILPLIFWRWRLRKRFKREAQELVVTQERRRDSIILGVCGSATTPHVATAIPVFREAIITGQQIVIDFSRTLAIDSRFFGLLLVLWKILKDRGAHPIIRGLPPRLERIFRLQRLEFLLASSGVEHRDQR